MEYISIGKLCKLLGISLSTAYRWLKSGKILPDFITFGGDTRFSISNIKKQILLQHNTSVLYYARVSTHGVDVLPALKRRGFLFYKVVSFII